MMSPFDEAAHRPIMGSPSKKKWSFSSSDLSSSSDGYNPPSVVASSFDVESQQQQEQRQHQQQQQLSSIVAPPPPSTTFNIDLVCDVDGGSTTTSTTSSTSSSASVSRLSWKSIDSFDQNRSTMEDLVQGVGRQQTQKSRMMSAIVSMGIILFFCYVVDALFVERPSSSSVWGGTDDDPFPSTEEGQDGYSPQVLIPGVITHVLHHHHP